MGATLACAGAFSFGEFREMLLLRMKQLSTENGEQRLSLPVGLFLVIDKNNGGDATAEELTKRFGLLDSESRNVIDFYFLGWRKSWGDGNIDFNLSEFDNCRQALKRAGVTKFGGNADLILVDAVYEGAEVILRFDEAIRVDLSASAHDDDFPTLGAFLESIIDAAEQVKNKALTSGLTYAISDQLGLAIATTSVLDFFFETWGKIIGAKKLQKVAVRNLGPKVKLDDWWS